MAVKPSVPPRRPRQQNDASLHEAVRAHWRGVVHRIGSVDNTARLDPDTVTVEPSVPARRPKQQNDASLHEAARAHWREVVRRARPVDNTARLDLDVDTTARVDADVDETARVALDREPVKPSVAPRRPRQQNDASLHEAVRGAGPAVTWFAAHDRLTTLHDFGGGPLGLRVRSAAETAERWCTARSCGCQRGKSLGAPGQADCCGVRCRSPLRRVSGLQWAALRGRRPTRAAAVGALSQR